MTCTLVTDMSIPFATGVVESAARDEVTPWSTDDGIHLKKALSAFFRKSKHGPASTEDRKKYKDTRADDRKEKRAENSIISDNDTISDEDASEDENTQESVPNGENNENRVPKKNKTDNSVPKGKKKDERDMKGPANSENSKTSVIAETELVGKVGASSERGGGASAKGRGGVGTEEGDTSTERVGGASSEGRGWDDAGSEGGGGVNGNAMGPNEFGMRGEGGMAVGRERRDVFALDEYAMADVFEQDRQAGHTDVTAVVMDKIGNKSDSNERVVNAD